MLWLILGGDAVNMGRAARLLEMMPKKLADIIKDDLQVSQAYIADHDWCERLAAHYPETWRLHAASFQQRLAGLPRRPLGRAAAINDETSFGHIVWKIIGGKDASVANAAERLHLHPSNLSAILHGRSRPTQQTIKKKRWRQTFARYYGEGWAAYRQVFEERARQLRIHKGLIKGQVCGPRARYRSA